jgi:EAL domain-containing protein (putative c-di-GMP-specific phosphodiesterase class I)
MAALVNEALDESGAAQLRLVFQPIVSLMGEEQENHSVLLRLLDADAGLHEAKAFISAATASGRMGDIDRWVITHAIAELAKQRAQGHRLNFFINIGETSLQDDDLLIWICDTLRDQDARGSWLTFQFPEEEARRNLPALTQLVEGLKKIKCRVALTRCGLLDDPKSLMQRLPLDFLLFAHDFARGLADDKVKQQQLLSFASLAHEFHVKSIVTGVEDARALTVLWTAGIDYVQGNFLQPPSPEIKLEG